MVQADPGTTISMAASRRTYSSRRRMSLTFWITVSILSRYMLSPPSVVPEDPLH